MNIEINDIILNSLNKNNLIGKGSEGMVYKIDDKTAVKIYNKFYGFLHGNTKISTLQEEASEIYKEKLEKLIERRNYIKKTTLPLGILTYRTLTVGALLEYKDNHETFSKFYNYNTDFVFTAFEYLSDVLEELCSFMIYYTDIHPSNTLIDINSDKVELIDVASEYIYSEDMYDNEKYNEVYYKLTEMLHGFLLTRYNKKIGLPLYEHLDSLNIKSDLIDKMLGYDITYDSFNEILSYLSENKTITNAKKLTLIR